MGKTRFLNLLNNKSNKFRIFSFCAPSTLCSPKLRSTRHYIVNHYVKILHVHLGVANNMHPLSWGGGAQTEKILNFLYKTIDY